MTQTKWLAYNDLAWTDLIITSPEECREETEYFVKAIRDHSQIEVQTLLHLGCGAGIYDYTFKRHFNVTGVDMSEGMLDIARTLNPEITYLCHDMQSIALKERFDAVAIPDSIGYLITERALRNTIKTAYEHLKPGGVLVIVALVHEDFQENNFVYTGSREEVEVTIFENNYVYESHQTTYEATLVYLIRRKGELEIFTDRHTLGLFPSATWFSLLADAGLEVKQMKMEHAYDRFISGDGAYPLRVFVCTQPL